MRAQALRRLTAKEFATWSKVLEIAEGARYPTRTKKSNRSLWVIRTDTGEIFSYRWFNGRWKNKN